MPTSLSDLRHNLGPRLRSLGARRRWLLLVALLLAIVAGAAALLWPASSTRNGSDSLTGLSLKVEPNATTWTIGADAQSETSRAVWGRRVVSTCRGDAGYVATARTRWLAGTPELRVAIPGLAPKRVTSCLLQLENGLTIAQITVP